MSLGTRARIWPQDPLQSKPPALPGLQFSTVWLGKPHMYKTNPQRPLRLLKGGCLYMAGPDTLPRSKPHSVVGAKSQQLVTRQLPFNPLATLIPKLGEEEVHQGVTFQSSHHIGWLRVN